MSDIFFFLTILKILILNIGKFIPLTINTYSFSNEVKKSCFLVHTGTTGFFCNFPHEFILIPNNHNKNLPKKILDVTNTDKNYLHYLNRHKPLFSIYFFVPRTLRLRFVRAAGARVRVWFASGARRCARALIRVDGV